MSWLDRCATRWSLALAGALATLIATLMPAAAVPSFSRQTGQDCATCHVGAYGPQLTPYGVRFKLGAYTETSGNDTKVPLSGMAVATASHTQKGQPGGAARGFGANDNVAFQELSAFAAGRIVDHVGAFVQVTYSGVDKKMALDNAEIRSAFDLNFGGTSAQVGVVANNNPTLSDPFATLPAWRFPFISADLAPAPSHAPMLDGGLEGRVAGTSAFAFFENGIYAELGGYGANNRKLLETVNILDRADLGQNIVGIAPYGRLAWFKDMKSQNFSVGVVGFAPSVRSYGLSGAVDRYTDLGVDANYQWLGNRVHVFTLGASWIYEWQTLGETFAGGGAASKTQTLGQFTASASYYYDKTWGLTARAFSSRGSADAVLYPGSGRPDTTGVSLQADWTPFGKEGSWAAPYANLRMGVQYTAYGRFDGARLNYDGSGRNAKDNNTFMAFLATSF